MKRIVILLLALCGLAAQAQTPQPRPPCWPSTFNGAGSAFVMYPKANVGTVIQWWCRNADGTYTSYGLAHPWMAGVKVPVFIPTSIASILGAFWDANVLAPHDPLFDSLQAEAKPYLDAALPPAPVIPAGPQFIVAPAVTATRAAYTVVDGKLGPVAVQRATPGQACDCTKLKVALPGQTFCAPADSPTVVTLCVPK